MMEMEHNLQCRTNRKRSNHCHAKPMFKKSRPELQFSCVPTDVQRIILSKLPLKEVIRTSILSSKWRPVCTFCPKLRFDGITMCSSRSTPGSEQYTKEFIRNVDAVLKQHNGEFVEDFEVKFELSNELIIHLDKWVRFAAASQAKNLALDLLPIKAPGQYDPYLLPHELLDSATTRRLLNIQLRFVSIELPSEFSGFLNLRKLDLHFVDIVAKDLPLMLSSCSSLEWLSMVMCHVGDELMVDLPLPRLQYLCVAYCWITRMKFNAMKLKTLVWRGNLCPFDLTQSMELKDAHFLVDDLSLTLDYALVTLPTMLPSVENFSLRANTPLKPPTLLERAWKFSRLKYLLLELCMNFEDEGSIVSLASYLRTVPLIEKLEIHFSICSFALSFSDVGPLKSLPRCPNNYLKTLYITGFMACRGHLDFLLHIVENAPVLESLTLDPASKFDQGRTYELKEVVFSLVRKVSKRYLTGRMSPNTKLCIL